MSDIAKKLGINRRTLFRWAAMGALTDEIPWSEFREKKDSIVLRESKKKALERVAEDNEQFFLTALDDVKDVYDSLIDRLKNDDTVQVSISDMKVLLTLAATLDNRGAEQMAWIENFLAKVAQIAIEIMDEQQFALFKSKMIQLVNEEKSKMNPLVKQKFVSKMG